MVIKINAASFSKFSKWPITSNSTEQKGHAAHIGFKGGLVSDFYRFWANLPKNVQNHSPELYPPKKKMPRIVFGNISWEIGANLKKNMRLSHLYVIIQILCSQNLGWIQNKLDIFSWSWCLCRVSGIYISVPEIKFWSS